MRFSRATFVTVNVSLCGRSVGGCAREMANGAFIDTVALRNCLHMHLADALPIVHVAISYILTGLYVQY